MLGKGNGPAGEGRNRALEKGIWEGVRRWKGAGKCVHAWCTKAIEFGEDSVRYVKVVRESDGGHTSLWRRVRGGSQSSG